MSVQLDSIPELDIDPYSPAFLEDPYPHYAQMRDAGPVVWLTRYRHYAVARHAETKVVLDDWETFGSTRGFGLHDPETERPLVDCPEYERLSAIPHMRSDSMRGLLDAVRPDPPEHDPIRRMFMRMLAPRLVRDWRERIFAAADELVASLVARGSFDAAGELADRFVLNVICDMVGLPQEGREYVIAYGNMAMNTSGPRNEVYLESIEQAVDAVAWVDQACSRSAITPGGIGELIFNAVDAGELEEEMGRAFVRVFPTAAVDTTSSTITNAIYDLLANPDQWALLREDPSLARKAFQETMRFTQAIHPLYRTTTRDSELGGVTVGGGVKMALFLGSANRDPRVFERPDRFEIARDATAQLGFGSGIHSCAGQTLARLEGEAVLSALIRHAGPGLALDGEPTRRRHNTLHTWSELPVKVGEG
jgi:4-methoxybenzoate monooxygenase (O-demethylating)